MNLFDGLKGLCQTRDGTAFLLTFVVSTTLCATKTLPGAYYAAIIATIFAIFGAGHAWQACTPTSIMNNPPNL